MKEFFIYYIARLKCTYAKEGLFIFDSVVRSDLAVRGKFAMQSLFYDILDIFVVVKQYAISMILTLIAPVCALIASIIYWRNRGK